MSTHNELREWEKAFIRIFITYEQGIEKNPLLREGLRQEDILSFIRSVLSREIEAERGRITAELQKEIDTGIENDDTTLFKNGIRYAIYLINKK